MAAIHLSPGRGTSHVAHGLPRGAVIACATALAARVAYLAGRVAGDIHRIEDIRRTRGDA